MSDCKKEADEIVRREINPVSYAWSHPVGQEEAELLGWFMSITLDDKMNLYNYWHRNSTAHRGKL